MKSPFLIVASIFLFATCSEAKTFTRCEFVKELMRQGFPKDKLADWNCLVRYESEYVTNKVGPVNYNGSRDYGIFQINDKYWCRHGGPGGECNVDCNTLLSDNISAASACAKKIYQKHGFRAWYGWQSMCQWSKPNINDCF